MTNLELVLNMLAEATTKEISNEKEPQTFEDSKKIAREGGTIAGNARKEIEEKTGKAVVTRGDAKSLSNSFSRSAGVLSAALTSPTTSRLILPSRRICCVESKLWLPGNEIFTTSPACRISGSGSVLVGAMGLAGPMQPARNKRQREEERKRGRLRQNARERDLGSTRERGRGAEREAGRREKGVGAGE
jgi:hypothetical protein